MELNTRDKRLQHLLDVVSDKRGKKVIHEDLAEKIGMKPQSFSRLVNGKRPITDKNAIKISSMLDVEPGYLLMESDEIVFMEKKTKRPGDYSLSQVQDSSYIEDIEMLLGVLKSGTDFSVSLRKNIRSFHEAVMERRNNEAERKKHESEMNELKKKNHELEKRIEWLEDIVRKTLGPDFFSDQALKKDAQPENRSKK
jgi:plasmid maintenance system antidote protein VapI